MSEGAGGLAAISVGISPWLSCCSCSSVVIVGGVKLVKLLWTMFS